jgi:hypothetical protein
MPIVTSPHMVQPHKALSGTADSGNPPMNEVLMERNPAETCCVVAMLLPWVL